MIIMKFLPGWDATLITDASKLSNSPTANKPFFSELIKKINTDNSSTPVHFVQKVLEKLMRAFVANDCLYGIFQAMNNSRLCPFIATHDYCIKAESSDQDGHLQMNISPIYHLGLDYPENYKTQHGKALEKEAIIGLLEKPLVGTLPPGHNAYSYGIDAGILFKDSKISHNEKMDLQLETINEGVLVSLSCKNQTTSRTVSWDEIGIHETPIINKKDTKILERLRE